MKALLITCDSRLTAHAANGVLKSKGVSGFLPLGVLGFSGGDSGFLAGLSPWWCHPQAWQHLTGTLLRRMVQSLHLTELSLRRTVQSLYLTELSLRRTVQSLHLTELSLRRMVQSLRRTELSLRRTVQSLYLTDLSWRRTAPFRRKAFIMRRLRHLPFLHPDDGRLTSAATPPLPSSRYAPPILEFSR